MSVSHSGSNLDGTNMEKCFSNPHLFRIRKDVSSKYKSNFDFQQQEALNRKRNALGIEEIIRRNAHRLLVVADTVGPHLVSCFIDRESVLNPLVATFSK